MQYKTEDRSRWPSGLTCGSAATRLLGLSAGIPPETMIYVSCEYYVLSGRGLCMRRAVHSSREVLMNVACLIESCIVNP
jgi:hypothetical protein